MMGLVGQSSRVASLAMKRPMTMAMARTMVSPMVSSRTIVTSKPALASYSVQDEEDFKTRVLGREAAVAAEEGAVDLAIVDIDDLAELAMEHEVNAVPTVLGMKGGKVVDKFVGLLEEDKLAAFIERVKDA